MRGVKESGIDRPDAGPDDRNLAGLSQGLDLTPDETPAVIEAIAPEIRHCLEARTLSHGGLADVVAIMGNNARRRILDPQTELTAQDAIARGNHLLDQIWQTQYRSRLVANRSAQKTVSRLKRSADCCPASPT